MEMNEKDIYEAFDLEYEGEKAAEAADPQDENDAEGGNGQEVAAPADGTSDDDEDIETLGDDDEADTDESDKDEAVSKAADDGAPKEKKAQTPEERAKHAAARRKAETEAAVAKARSEAEETARNEIEELLKLSDLKDPTTGKTITTLDELKASKAAFAAKQKNDLLKRTGMNGDDLDKLVADLPEVKAAREAAERAKQDAARAQIDSDIAEISKIDPNIKTLEDLASDSRYDVIYKRVTEHNDSLLDAYSYAYGDVISEKRLEAAMAAARQKSAGKAHMLKTTARGGGTVTMSKAEMAAYKAFNDGASDADIAKFHQKYVERNRK